METIWSNDKWIHEIRLLCSEGQLFSSTHNMVARLQNKWISWSFSVVQHLNTPFSTQTIIAIYLSVYITELVMISNVHYVAISSSSLDYLTLFAYNSVIAMYGLILLIVQSLLSSYFTATYSISLLLFKHHSLIICKAFGRFRPNHWKPSQQPNGSILKMFVWYRNIRLAYYFFIMPWYNYSSYFGNLFITDWAYFIHDKQLFVWFSSSSSFRAYMST